MHVLFLALTIYLLGVTIVLYLRPKLMFHPGGTWKEFSLNPDPNRTWMPFWLFSVLWAFISYLVATGIQRFLLSAGSNEVDADIEDMDMPEVEVEEPTPVRNRSRKPVNLNSDMDMDVEPVSKNMGLNTSKNGFYVLNTKKYNSNHVPTYVYYGDQPPEGFMKDS
uniref:Uncharacterized protein n=1 Tax=viral metagenome TaxID=1070528 RepID=A0A6C0BJV3_9ZZZZ